MPTMAFFRRTGHCVLALVAWTGLLISASTTAQPLTEHTLVDRIVAVVDNEPILWSDIVRAGALDEGPANIPTTADDPQARQLLDRLIDQRLRLREVERFASSPVPAGEVEQQMQQLRERQLDEGAWDAQLDAVGLDEAGLRHQLQRQLRILRYVDQRLGPRVFVSPDDIQAYYETTLRPTLEADGASVPPLEAVRDAIRNVVHQQRLNQEIEAWTATLRGQATIVDVLAAPPRPLPPVIRRVER